ncbi:hypothetical protein [Polaromonas sp.]|uniref:hypothetical protein n=1 Tax=Polaromonas sp. TaxID=1869339 RepID=UPI002BC24699|nr:hypothetical protein [Polaromonas sp.]HQS31078.1 hypothetical protein [Polaromonas sp.]HQS90219.1 hypothetical protein [Polaromonas sp.]
MNHTPLGYMGPPPFKFLPRAAGAEGPAFSVPFKILATLIVLACVAAFVQTWLAGRASGVALAGGWFIAGLLLVVYTWFCILRSITRIDAQGLHQSWVWDKHMELQELAYGKLIRVRGLDWLIAPRLYVRTLMGKFAVFYAASPEMVAEFERLVSELKAFRSMR